LCDYFRFVRNVGVSCVNILSVLFNDIICRSILVICISFILFGVFSLTWYYAANYVVLKFSLIVRFEASCISDEGKPVSVYDWHYLPLHEMVVLQEVLEDYV
jgi:hypothetical protein